MPNLKQVLSSLQEEFYEFPEQTRPRYLKTFKNGARYIPFRRAQGLDAWLNLDTQQSDEISIKKKILLCDYGFSSITDIERLRLVDELLKEGFELFILSHENVLLPIDPKRKDFSYLLGCQHNQVLRKGRDDSDENFAEEQLRKCGESPEQWNILDHYAVEKLLHLKSNQECATKASNFSYKVVIDSKSPKELLTKRNSPIHRKQIEQLVVSAPLSRDTIHHLQKVKKLTTILADPIELLKNFNNLTQLDINGAPLKDSDEVLAIISSLKSLKELSLRAFKGNFTQLAPSLIQSLEHFAAPTRFFKIEQNEQEVIDVSSFANLKKLVVYGEIQELRGISEQLEELELTTCSSHPQNVSNFYRTRLQKISLTDFDNIDSIEELPDSLQKLVLTNCSLKSLQDLSYTVLTELKLHRCYNLSQLPILPATLKKLEILNCQSLKTLPGISHTVLEKIDITNGKQLTQLPEFPATLKSLALSVFSSLESLPDLSHTLLEELSLSHFKKLTQLSESPNHLPATIKKLELKNCSSLKSLPDFSRTSLEILDLSNCKALTQLPEFPSTLKFLNLEGCDSLTTLPDFSQGYPGLVVVYPKHLQPFSKDESTPTLPSTQVQDTKIATRSNNSLAIPASTLDGDTHRSPDMVHTAHYAIYKMHQGRVTSISPSDYRQHIQDKIIWDEVRDISIEQAAGYKDSKAELPIQVTDRFSQEAVGNALNQGQYFAEIPIRHVPDWTPLPTLSAADEIISMHKPEDCKLRYNSEKEQYEYRWDAALESYSADDAFKLQYIFATNNDKQQEQPKEPEFPPALGQSLERLFDSTEALGIHVSPDFAGLRESMKDLRSKETSEKLLYCLNKLPLYFKSFDRDGHDTLDDVDQDRPRLERILMQARGACDFRATLYVMLCQHLGIAARLVKNDIHSFAEIYVDGRWQAIDLGGSSKPTLRFDPPPISYKDDRFSPSESKVSESKNSTAERPNSEMFRIWGAFFDASQKVYPPNRKSYATVLEDLTKEKSILLEMPDLKAGRNLYAALTQKFPDREVFYIESSEDIQDQWKLFKIHSNGEMESIPGNLQKLLTTGQGTLVFNWGGRFNATEIASYMGINDQERNFCSLPVSDKLNVINLVTPKTPVGERFYSRCQRFTWPPQVPQPLAYEIKPKKTVEEIKEGKQSKERAEPDFRDDVLAVDLYGGTIDWKEALLGIVGRKAGHWIYTPGALSQKQREIQLIDAPWHDPEFQRFMLECRTTRRVTLNGEIVTLPVDFTFSCGDTPKKPSTLPKILQPQPTADWKPDHKQHDIFYLNQDNFASLLKQQIFRDGEIDTEEKGWLQQAVETGKTKQIVLTEPLTAGHWRQLHEVLSNYKFPISWVDLTQSPTPSPASRTAADLKAVHPQMAQGNCIIETQDPYFLAQQVGLADAKALLVPIHSSTTTNELFETLSEEPAEHKTMEEQEKSDVGYSHQVLAIAEALKQEKTVVLYGQLSVGLYRALEPLLTDSPQLKLLNEVNPQPILGKLIIASPPLTFQPRLANQQGRFFSVPDILWKDYRRQLQQDYPKGDLPEHLEQLQKVRDFYRLADQVTHGQTGTPPLLRLTYARLNQFLQTLKQNEIDNDNPLKPFFHRDYDASSENYAYLNVLAKAIFGPGQTKDKDTKYQTKSSGGIRQYKFERYSADTNHFWRRLNCLDSHALQQFFSGQEKDALTQLKEFRQDKSRGFSQLQHCLSKGDFQPILPNPDPQEKIWTQLQKMLKHNHVVTLKGEPGAGKTYNAWKYANLPGKQAFFGEEGLMDWLTHQPVEGEESVLIIDEANMQIPGYWDFLMPLLENKEKTQIWYQGQTRIIPPRHKVIFTANPEHYPSRHYQGILQDSAQLYAPAWTRETLNKNILQPTLLNLATATQPEKEKTAPIDSKSKIELSEQLSPTLSTMQPDESKPAHTLPEAQIQTLEILLTAIQSTCQLLSPDAINNWHKPMDEKTAAVSNAQLSLRDAQQLMVRWHYHLQFQDKPLTQAGYRQAAYEACVMEWGHRFSTQKENTAFRLQMEALFQPMIPQMADFGASKHHDSILKRLSSTHYLNNTQQEWLLVILEDIALSKMVDKFKLTDPVSKAPLVKSGTLLEGSSGLGKTSLFLGLLQAMGKTPISADELLKTEQTADLSQHYVQFTPSANRTNDRELLLKAHTVAMDELSLEPSLESLLNQRLTGKTTNGKKDDTPSIYVLASQNSRQHAGNKASSLGLKNRFHLLNPQLSIKDLKEIVNIALTGLIADEQLRSAVAGGILADFLQKKAASPDSVNLRKFFQGLRNIVQKATELKQNIAEQDDITNAKMIHGWVSTVYDNSGNISFLIALGISVNAVYRGESLLLTAIRKGDLDTIRCLVTLGVDVNDKSDNDLTPLQVAMSNYALYRKKSYLDIIQILIANKADLEMRTSDDDTPLQLAVELNIPDVLELLINSGADIEKSGYKKLLDIAKKNKSTECLVLLKKLEQLIKLPLPNSTHIPEQNDHKELIQAEPGRVRRLSNSSTSSSFFRTPGIVTQKKSENQPLGSEKELLNPPPTLAPKLGVNNKDSDGPG